MLIKDEDVGDWRDLQNKVQQLFGEMGYYSTSPHVVELSGRGRKEVDVFVEDRRTSSKTIYLVECKWWETNVPQDTVHAFHTVMQGAGANTGFIVSKVGFQSGAREAIQSTNINLLTFEDLQHAFGEEWFRFQQSQVHNLATEMDQRHHLHFDQWNMLPIHNNMMFHTPDLQLRLMMAAKQCTNLIIQSRSRFPESYLGPEPVTMASDPSDPQKKPPDGKVWHEAATVRDYFTVLRSEMSKWIAEFDSLCDEAKHSFEQLGDCKQDNLMQESMLAHLEETPVRVLKRHLTDQEYQRLLGLLAKGIADAAAGSTSDTTR